MSTSLDDIIELTRKRIAGPELYHDHADWPPVLFPVATPRQVEEAENALGFELPPLLKRIYTEIANGGAGFGPAYGIAGVAGAGTDEKQRDIMTLYQDQSSGKWKQEYPRWPARMLRLACLGCGMYTTLDCSTPDYQLYLYEPNMAPDPDSEDMQFVNCLFAYHQTFEQWWLEWAQGKDVQLPEAMREPELSDEEMAELYGDEESNG